MFDPEALDGWELSDDQRTAAKAGWRLYAGTLVQYEGTVRVEPVQHVLRVLGFSTSSLNTRRLPSSVRSISTGTVSL